jgi:redox-sensitive bicupin YhaK (pirin superfamily)
MNALKSPLFARDAFLTSLVSRPFAAMLESWWKKVAPMKATRGVGEHPHRGFEIVAIVYQGELEHRDSSGSHGTIGAGDVR